MGYLTFDKRPQNIHERSIRKFVKKTMKTSASRCHCWHCRMFSFHSMPSRYLSRATFVILSNFLIPWQILCQYTHSIHLLSRCFYSFALSPPPSIPNLFLPHSAQVAFILSEYPNVWYKVYIYTSNFIFSEFFKFCWPKYSRYPRHPFKALFDWSLKRLSRNLRLIAINDKITYIWRYFSLQQDFPHCILHSRSNPWDRVSN